MRKTLILSALVLAFVFLGGVSAKALSTFIVDQGGTGRATFTSSQLLYGNGTNALSSVATGTIAYPTGLTGTANRYVVGGNLTIGLDTGYVIPLQSTLDALTPQTRTITVAGTANQITSSAGAQDLSANRTWTLSIPSRFIFPNSFEATYGTTTYASSTAFSSDYASSTFAKMYDLVSHVVRGDASDGLLVEANNGTDVAILGAGNTANATFYGGVNIDGATRLATSLGGFLGANNGAVYSFATSSISTSQLTNDANFITRASLSATAPIVYNNGTGVFSWTGLATTSQPSSSNLLTSNGSAGVYGTATTSLSGNSQIALSQAVNVLGASPSVLSIVADSIGDTQLAFNTGQNLTTASSPTFAGLTLSGLSNGCLQAATGVITSTGVACGSGGSSAFEIATTSTIAVPQLAYFTQASGRTTLGGVSTSTLSGTGVVSISNSPVILGASGAVASLTGGVNGQILGWSGGVPTWLATTTFSSGLSYSAGNVTNTSPLSGLTVAFPFSFSNPTLSWIGLATSTALANTQITYGTAANTIGSEAAFTYDPATNTFTTDNGIISTSLRIPNGTGPTTDAAGEIAFDTDAWTRGAVQAFDGTANTYLVGVLASDAPSNGQVPQWNTGGTITWETPTGGGGAGSTHWATTSPWSGKYVLYPSDSGADLCLSASATSSCKFWFDVDNSIEYVGQYGSADSFQTFSSDGTATTSLGMDFSDGEAFKISLSSTLDTATVATILQNGRVGFGTTSPWGSFSISTSTITVPVLSVATSTGDTYSQLLNVWATSTTQINTSALALPDTSGVRVFIGGLKSYAQLAFNFAQLYIQGWYDQSDSQAFCDSPVGATAISADGVAGCGGFFFNEDGTGTLTALSPTNGGYTYGQLSTTAANDGAGVFLNAASAGAFSIATSTPIFAADARIASVQLATTSHNFYIGFTNLATAGTTYETRPTQGCYFTASSTEANWKAVSQNSAANITITDTGVASSSVITGTGEWRRFYVVTDASHCYFFLQNGQSNDLKTVASHTTNLPTSVLNAGVYMADTLSGAGALFDVKRIRAWWRDFIPAL